jgi:Family of unknown function (DUF5762)
MSQSLKSNKVSFDLSNNKTIEIPNDNNAEAAPTQGFQSKQPRRIPFWAEDPNILFQQKYLLEFFPVENMTYEQKLNAVTRTVILLSIIGFLLSRSIRTVIISLVTLAGIYVLHYYHEKEKSKSDSKKLGSQIAEGFDSPAVAYLKEKHIEIPTDAFDVPTSHNPFDNVLMTDYDYNPNKKPAPPAFNKNINDQILTSAKQLVQEANPDQPDIADKLFNSMGDNLVFEQSMRQFNSNPSTTIPNDQNAFAQFCYGNAISSKEGNPFSLARNMSHYTLY